MDKIELFLDHLNPREKFLFAFLVCLCALFLAFKFHHSFIQDSFEKTLIEHNYLYLNEIKMELLDLEKTKINLIEQIKTHQEKIKYYEQKLQLFSHDENFFIKEIDYLKSNLTLDELQISYENKDLFVYHEIFLSLNGDFNPILSFIQNLENSNLYFHIHDIEMDNLSSLKLNLKLKISFITLIRKPSLLKK